MSPRQFRIVAVSFVLAAACVCASYAQLVEGEGRCTTVFKHPPQGGAGSGQTGGGETRAAAANTARKPAVKSSTAKKPQRKAAAQPATAKSKKSTPATAKKSSTKSTKGAKSSKSR